MQKWGWFCIANIKSVIQNIKFITIFSSHWNMSSTLSRHAFRMQSTILRLMLYKDNGLKSLTILGKSSISDVSLGSELYL